MLRQDPAVILLHLLREGWDDAATDDSFDPSHISTGWYSETRSHPQITITHQGDSVTGNTGYTHISSDGPVAWQGGRMQIDIWVPNTDDWRSAGRAKKHRWELQQEVKRIIHLNATGTADESGDRQLQSLGTIAARRNTDSSTNPLVFRSSLDIRYSYEQRPPPTVD
jgi:hypothetical protein